MELRKMSYGARGPIAVWIVVAVIGLASIADASTEDAASLPQATTQDPGPQDEFDRGTPRSAVMGFLTACRDGDYERAANYLHLGSVPTSRRAQRGPALARKLKTLLDRELWIDPDQLSDEAGGFSSDGLRARSDLVGVIHADDKSVDIVLDRVPRGDGVSVWKFSSRTVREIPALYEQFGYGRLGAWLPPVFFESHMLEIQLWQWLGLLAVLFVAFLASWFAARGLALFARPLVGRSTTEIDDRLLAALIGPLRLLSGGLIFYIALPLLSLSSPAREFLTNTVKVNSLVAATWLVLRFIDVAADLVQDGLSRRGATDGTALVPMGRKFIKVVIVGLALLASLDSFGFDITALIAGLGVGGLAVALAAQKTIENLFGGITLIADRPVQVGDFCRFGDSVGTVEEIGMRSTRVRTLERTIITIPNSEFSSLQLENFGKRDMMKYSPRLGLLYATTPDQLRYVLVEIRKMLYSHPKVVPDPARVRFVNFGDSSLDIDIFAYVRATDFSEYLGIAEDLHLRLMDIVAESGTGFAFPSTTTYLARDEGTSPERTQHAEAEVQKWKESNELFLPGFTPEKIDSLAGSLPFPPPGAPAGVER
ncbi:MAG: mechanosensitive ion channel family protein [Myxococcota bacterium]